MEYTHASSPAGPSPAMRKKKKDKVLPTSSTAGAKAATVPSGSGGEVGGVKTGTGVALPAGEAFMRSKSEAEVQLDDQVLREMNVLRQSV